MRKILAPKVKGQRTKSPDVRNF